MLSSKATGWMLALGILGFAVMSVSQFAQGDQDGTAEVLAWVTASNKWELIGFMRMVTVVLMLVFTVGFTSWARSISDSSSAINVGKYFALFALMLLWIGFISEITGFEIASENPNAAYSLIELSNMGFWFGGVCFALSFFLVGVTAYSKKTGTPAVNGLLGILGIVAAVGSFFNWFLWLGGFGLGLLVLAIIGLKKVVRG